MGQRLRAACQQEKWGLQQICSFLHLVLQAVLMPARFSGILVPFTDSTKHALQNLFAFCYVWALGGTLEAASRLVPGCCLSLAMLSSNRDEVVKLSFEGCLRPGRFLASCPFLGAD